MIPDDCPPDELAARRAARLKPTLAELEQMTKAALGQMLDRMQAEIDQAPRGLRDFREISWAEALNRLLDEGVYVPPHPWMRLHDAMEAIRARVLLDRDLPDGRVELLHRWYADAAEILSQPAPGP